MPRNPLVRRLEALEAAMPASSVWPPAAAAWNAAHGWLPAGFCWCLAAQDLGGQPEPCNRCPRAARASDSPALRALHVEFYTLSDFAERNDDAR